MDDVQEMNLIPQFAEAMLIKSASPAAVTTIVTTLLLSKGEKHECNNSTE